MELHPHMHWVWIIFISTLAVVLSRLFKAELGVSGQ